MNWKLLVQGKRILGKKLEGNSCPRKHLVVFWTFHTFPCIFFPRTIFSSSSRLVRYRDKCMTSSKHDWTLSGTATSLQFFLKILFLVPKVSNSWIFQERWFMKIIWHRISIQTLLFQACLPTRQNGVENRDKAYFWFLKRARHTEQKTKTASDGHGVITAK